MTSCFLLFSDERYSVVGDGNESALIQVAHRTLIHLLAHLEAMLDVLSVALVAKVAVSAVVAQIL